MRNRRLGSKERIKRFFLSKIGEVVTSIEIRDAAGADVSEWARRLRELRASGWKILSDKDDSTLSPGQYRMDEMPVENPHVKFERPISAKLRAQVLDRNGFTCVMCGATPGEIDANTGRKVRLHIGHIKDKSLGGLDELSNLRALCSTCNQGAKNVTTEKPSTIWLLAQIRRAGSDEQRAVLRFLKTKFKDSGS
jgi:hypothetical protein